MTQFMIHAEEGAEKTNFVIHLDGFVKTSNLEEMPQVQSTFVIMARALASVGRPEMLLAYSQAIGINEEQLDSFKCESVPTVTH